MPGCMLFFSENSISSATGDADLSFYAIGSTRQKVVALLRSHTHLPEIRSQLASDIQLVFQEGLLATPSDVQCLFDQRGQLQADFNRLWGSMLEKYPDFELYLFKDSLSLLSMSEEEKGARLIEWFYVSKYKDCQTLPEDCRTFMKTRLDLFGVGHQLHSLCEEKRIVDFYLAALAEGTRLSLGCAGALIHTDYSSSDSNLYIWLKGDNGSRLTLVSSFEGASTKESIHILEAGSGFTSLRCVCQRSIKLPTKASSALSLYSGAKFFPGALAESFRPFSTTPTPDSGAKFPPGALDESLRSTPTPADPDSTGGHASGPFRPVALASAKPAAPASSGTPVMPAAVVPAAFGGACSSSEGVSRQPSLSVPLGTFVFGGQSSGAAGVASAAPGQIFSFQFTPPPASAYQQSRPKSRDSRFKGRPRTEEELTSFFARLSAPDVAAKADHGGALKPAT